MKKWTAIVGGITVGLAAYALTEPFRCITKHYQIKDARIPEVFDGFKIAFLADVHYGRLCKRRYVSKVVETCNAMQPDLVLLGGDYITHKKHIKPCFEELSKLCASYGKYGVIGNHDVIEDLEQTERGMQRARIGSINNDAVWIVKENSRIKIGGVGDLHTQEQNIVPTLHGLTKRDYAVLVTHNPKYVHCIEETHSIGLVLAGHTHGAQFSALSHLGGIVPSKIKHRTGLTYLSGHYKKDGMDIIVSNGVGTAKFPLRVMTPPEIVMVELRSK